MNRPFPLRKSIKPSARNVAPIIDELLQRYSERLRPESLIFKAQPQTQGSAEKAIGEFPSDGAPDMAALEPDAFEMWNNSAAASAFARTNYAPSHSSEEAATAVSMISSALRSLRTASPGEKSPEALAKDDIEPREMEDTLGGMQTLFNTSEMKSSSANDAQSIARTVGEQVVRHINEVADGINRRETRSLRINLRPEELGRVEIEVKRDSEGRLSAQLTVGNDSAHHALSDGLSQLREALDRAGLNFDSLNINYNAQLSSHQGGQSSGSRRDQADGLLQPNTSGVENSGTSADTESSQSDLSKLVSIRA
jgi:flagellar hook-length control protein FliK